MNKKQKERRRDAVKDQGSWQGPNRSQRRAAEGRKGNSHEKAGKPTRK